MRTRLVLTIGSRTTSGLTKYFLFMLAFGESALSNLRLLVLTTMVSLGDLLGGSNGKRNSFVWHLGVYRTGR
jgi:hypothetical protein